MLQKDRLHLRIATAFLLLMFGCTSGSKTNDIQKYVFPAQCENACWMGIEPKISTVDEASEILGRNYGYENIAREESAGVITWDAHNANWHDRGIVVYSNNIVDHILVWPSGADIDVKGFIRETGSPEGVALVVSGPNTKCAGASLVYPQKGLQAYLSPADKSVGVVETQIINGLGIYLPWTADSFPWTDTETVPWEGYREYCPEKWPWED